MLMHIFFAMLRVVLGKRPRAIYPHWACRVTCATLARPQHQPPFLPPPEAALPGCNISPALFARVDRGLHRDAGHPLGAVAAAVAAHFGAIQPPAPQSEAVANAAIGSSGSKSFTLFDALPPIVTVKANFDDLLTPADHISRARTDTFYVDSNRLLRCHMTAHQTELLRRGWRRFLMVGDVFRRDEIDATHFPVFHQADGVCVWSPEELITAAGIDAAAQRAYVLEDLRARLDGLVSALFGAGAERRWVDASFPFTAPSLEMEVRWEGRWLEVLGCGEIRPEILGRCSLPAGTRGWAFGLGLERLAMVLFGVPDIRLFWSDDTRFHDQFRGPLLLRRSAPPGAPWPTFRPYSRQPPCFKDVSFWLPPAFHDNDLFDLIRGAAGDVVEAVARTDEFTHPRSGRVSRCFRITYRDMDRTLTNAEVDAIQARVRKLIAERLGAELR